MGSQGGSAPNPYTQRQATTSFLRVPFMDWPRVKIGEKTEFRTRGSETSRLLRTNPPTPVVAYAINGHGHHVPPQLMVLEEHRYEPLFAISEDPEAIKREGFEDYDHFRRYWRKRRKGAYLPMEYVHVWRVRLWRSSDATEQGLRLIEHLYGDWLSTVVNEGLRRSARLMGYPDAAIASL